jgi:hypothetical protein
VNRSVIIHRNGSTEVRDVNPTLHQQLRGLAYRRFVLKFARALDGVTMTSAVYAHLPPSSWQVTTAAELIWGRVRGVTGVYDDEGHQLNADDESASPTRPATGSNAVVPSTTSSSATAPPASTPASAPRRLLLGENETIVLEPKGDVGHLPLIRVRAVSGRGWVVEASEWTIGSEPSWTEVHVVPEISLL